MKNKGSLALMEMLLMLFVFAQAAAWCLQVFIKADIISKQINERDRAVFVAQNIAEFIKAGKNPELSEDDLQVLAGDYFVEILCGEVSTPGLGQAQIVVFSGEKEAFSLQVAWQEETR